MRGRAVFHETGPDATLMTALITFLPEPGKQAWIDEYNQSETRDHIRHLDGFISASFLVAERSQRLVEIVQWRSPADFAAAFSENRFREHVTVTKRYAASDVASYRIRQTLERP